MKIRTLDTYKRRGTMCRFTFEISDVKVRSSDPEDERTTTHGWAYMEWDGFEWHCKEAWAHEFYVPHPMPWPRDFVAALAGSVASERAVAAMKRCA
jgi:hypothetical protein